MKIYITKISKPLKEGSRPIIRKQGFGDDFSSPLHYSFIEFVGILHEIYEKVLSRTLFESVYKEVKFTITLKF